MFRYTFFFVLLASLFACNSTQDNTNQETTYADVQIAGAMRNVMWKGELDGIIQLDTIQNKKGLYGLGPLSYLQGELLINDGQAYVSRVLTDSIMQVEATFDASAPFFVYANVNEWKELDLPKGIKTIAQLEAFIDEQTKAAKRPFAFKLKGEVAHAIIHIQNLPKGTAVSSPQEAHQGQTNYPLGQEKVDIVGFFSTSHQGVFTHHDSFLHLHLITSDQTKMGHLDEVEFGAMKLYLPVQ